MIMKNVEEVTQYVNQKIWKVQGAKMVVEFHWLLAEEHEMYFQAINFQLD
jgi:hypothetical protein